MKKVETLKLGFKNFDEFIEGLDKLVNNLKEYETINVITDKKEMSLILSHLVLKGYVLEDATVVGIEDYEGSYLFTITDDKEIWITPTHVKDGDTVTTYQFFMSLVDEPEEDNSIFLVSEDAISKFEELDVLEQLLTDGASFLFYEF